MFSRRDVLAASAVGTAMTVSAAKAGSFGNPDEPPEGAINAKNPASVTDPGPQNPAIRDQLQSAFSPPPTDIGGMPQIWSSFNTVQRRIQDGGWARQVPSRPRGFHPEPLTDPDLILSHHPARAID
jgi:oxalate decarboxylase